MCAKCEGVRGRLREWLGCESRWRGVVVGEGMEEGEWGESVKSGGEVVKVGGRTEVKVSRAGDDFWRRERGVGRGACRVVGSGRVG